MQVDNSLFIISNVKAVPNATFKVDSKRVSMRASAKFVSTIGTNIMEHSYNLYADPFVHILFSTSL